ncbi:MAG: M14 family metallopeptidase [Pirellulaceae bacterium]
MRALATLEHWPQELQTLPAHRLHERLTGPTLIHLAGRRPEPLFVSVLLHGNEDVGLVALQKLFARCSPTDLPRSLSIFIGNVPAATSQLRRLDGQVDYNRVWPGTEAPPSPERALMQHVFEIMLERRVFASIDLHNNTGCNPHYACINRVEPTFLHFASLFSRTVVYFTRPKGVQSAAFALICPAVTCECGKVGDESGAERASEFIEAALHLSEHPHSVVSANDVHVFHTVATATIPQHVSFGFDDPNADLQFDGSIDHLNFQELPPGFVLGRRKTGSSGIVSVRDHENRDVTDDFLVIEGDELRLRRPVMPSMLTLDSRVIRQDCLGYFMERWPLAEPVGS